MWSDNARAKKRVDYTHLYDADDDDEKKREENIFKNTFFVD